MFKPALLTATAVFLTAGHTLAADLFIAPSIQPTSYSASSYDWSGFYAGLVGGYTIGHATYSDAPDPVYGIDAKGGLFGATIGFNQQFDQFVVGVEGEILWSGSKGTLALTGGDLQTKSDWEGALKARAGVALDRVMIYGHAGLSVADIKSTLTAAGGTSTNNAVRPGFTVGAGLELAVTDTVSIKGEYAYSDYGKYVGKFTGAFGGDADVTYKSHALKAGVNVHF